MVAVYQKVGTLFIEYKPPETMSALSYDAGLFCEDDCDHFVLITKFFPGYVPMLPIYALDPKCYSSMRIKCYSIFDAIDFIEHLGLEQFEFKFSPSKIDSTNNSEEEFDILEVEFEGALADLWSMRVRVAQKDEQLVSTSREDAHAHFKNLKRVFLKNQYI